MKTGLLIFSLTRQTARHGARSLWPAFFLLLCLFFSSPVFSRDTLPPQTTLKIATLAPKGLGWAEQWKTTMLSRFNEKTGGRFRIKVYWGGIMGDDREVLRKMRKGLLDGAGISGQGVMLAVPQMAVLELPFLFRNYDEVDHIREKMMPAFDRLTNENGFFLSGWIDQSFDFIFSSRYRMNRMEDFENARFMSVYGAMEESMLRAMGADPIPVHANQASRAMHEGRVNAGLGPAVWIVGAQVHPLVKFVNPLKIRYAPGLMLQNLSGVTGSPEKEQLKKALLELRARYIDEFNQKIRQENEKHLSALLQYGIAKTSMDPHTEKALRIRTRKVWKDMAGVLYSQELLDTLTGNLEAFRADNPGPSKAP